jgi:zinc-ribbon domain
MGSCWLLLKGNHAIYFLSGGKAMRHCENCGSELRANARFCGHCGQKISNETEVATNSSDAPIEDIPMSPSATSMTLNESQDSSSENGELEKQQTPGLPSENEEEDRQTPDLTLENEEEDQQTPYPLLENGEVEDQQSLGLISKDEKEEELQQDYIEPSSSMPVDADSEPEIPTNQLLDDQSQYQQTQSVPQKSHSPYDSTQKRGSRPVSKCLLFFLAGLIVVVGVVAALIGLMHVNLSGIGGSSNALSSSSGNEIIKPTGSSLTASICVKPSTPSTSVTNEGTVFILFSSSGCSTVMASKANSSCLIFRYNTGAAHKFIFDVSNAAIDSKSYHLILGVVDYTGPTIYNDAGHVSVGLSEGSTGRNFSWLYRSGSVTINNDEQSGTMDVILVAVNGGSTLHVVGDWACGRQIKNT